VLPHVDAEDRAGAVDQRVLAVGVLEISSLPFLTESQAQPEPNWVVPAATKSALNLS
jgi:hypothetical protein